MLKDLLKSVEQEINSIEHKQARKDNFYRYIDETVKTLLANKLEGYSFFTGDNLKGTDSERNIQIYQGEPVENEYYWKWKEERPCINIWYKIKLTSFEIESRWNNWKEYNLKNFSFQFEYNDNECNFELSDKFEELNEVNSNEIIRRKEQLIKSRENFISFLDDIKQAVINNEDIRIARKKILDVTFDWHTNGIDATENTFTGLLKAYDELISYNRKEQD